MSAPEAAKRQGTTLAFAYVTTLFFAWGFATSLIDPLIAAVKRVFDLNNAEAFLTTFAWFIAYGLMSLPAAAVLGTGTGQGGRLTRGFAPSVSRSPGTVRILGAADIAQTRRRVKAGARTAGRPAAGTLAAAHRRTRLRPLLLLPTPPRRRQGHSN